MSVCARGPARRTFERSRGGGREEVGWEVGRKKSGRETEIISALRTRTE